ncbi:MAG: DUF368 domain-containing protein [Firmicutes bacterium]|nr:DUF368 domain-containing protein [Bacillota bacterium]
MKEKLILILKGIIIGAGKIIPGVSGGMLAITLNVYDRAIKSISNFFKNVKENFTFLFTLGIGILLSILSVSKLIEYTLDNYYLPTMLLFIGMIIGGIPSIVNEAKQEKSLKNIIIMLIPFILIFILSITSNIFNMGSVKGVKVIPMILIGIVDAITMIIPGISGTAILMMLGYYDIIISSFSSFTNLSLLSYNLSIIIPFGIGMIIGVITLSKIINYLLNKYRISCLYAIIGFSISSILLLLIETLKNNYYIGEVLISLVLLVVGYFISSRLDKVG